MQTCEQYSIMYPLNDAYNVENLMYANIRLLCFEHSTTVSTDLVKA